MSAKDEYIQKVESARGVELPQYFETEIILSCIPDTEHRMAGSGVCPIKFQFCCGSIFLCYASLALFWNENIYFVTLYVENVRMGFSTRCMEGKHSKETSSMTTAWSG